MSGMAVVCGSKLVTLPSTGLRSGSNVSSSTSRCCVAAAGAKPSMAVVGLGRRPLRLQSDRVATSETKRSLTIVAAKAEGQVDVTQFQGAAEDVLKKIQDAWAKVDDKLAIGGLGFVGIIVLWGSTGLISAIDKLPLIPDFFELVGLLFSGWFIYRYLLFKPDREELLKVVDDTKSKITGQE